MTIEIKKIYKAALKNKTFLQDIKEADNDVAPSIFASENEKIGFTLIYYGWLVGKYGNQWKINIKI